MGARNALGRRLGLTVALALSTLGRDTTGVEAAPTGPAVTACEGDRPPLPAALFFRDLRAAAFPGSDATDAADVAVHVPPGFDATRRPGVVLYFHGWNGCVAQALADDDAPCTPDGDARAGAGLAAQLDEAGVNAILVAVELRVDAPTGEPGQLAAPGDARQLLRELFTEHLAEPLGCTLELEAIDRVVLVAHSGGYQAVASALELGELPRVHEVVLLDALYGADHVFTSWITDALEGSRDGDSAPRFVDLYTCCGGTLERSRAMARAAGLDRADDDTPQPTLTRPVVFARVAEAHGALPRAYFRAIIEAAGFAPRSRSGLRD